MKKISLKKTTISVLNPEETKTVLKQAKGYTLLNPSCGCVDTESCTLFHICCKTVPNELEPIDLNL